jgi:hypothetical protein
MKGFTGDLEPPGRGTRIEASAEYLAEERSVADISQTLASDGLPPPADMSGYTATLGLGFWVSHILRVGSPQFIDRINPDGPALSPCLQTIWPAQPSLS